MENDRTSRKFESVYSSKVRAGKRRTYFFDVRKTKGDDYYITLTESTRKFNGQGYERHKIFLYKEDFNRFLASLEETINHVKEQLMPDYDYDEFTRRNEEYEKRRAEELAKEASTTVPEEAEEAEKPEEGDDSDEGEQTGNIENEDDMSW